MTSSRPCLHYSAVDHNELVKLALLESLQLHCDSLLWRCVRLAVVALSSVPVQWREEGTWRTLSAKYRAEGFTNVKVLHRWCRSMESWGYSMAA